MQTLDLIAQERIALLETKHACGEWTEEEAERFDALNAAISRLSPRVTPQMLMALESLARPEGHQHADA